MKTFVGYENILYPLDIEESETAVKILEMMDYNIK